ncbi:hypothetical protein [Cyclobacterium xiamenense]|jgi:hypothetical protein|uniref:hypothetical protein n=1 Tax=Cyclobacterium xiamenense TaxID=1297121 RepID=UPI0035CF6A1F
MKEAIEKLTEKIPDIWFDWYARLLPGCLAISFYLITNDIPMNSVRENGLVLLFSGYLLGHLIQPLSSGLINLFSDRIKRKKAKLVSKAYAEFVGFFSLALLTVLLIVMDYAKAKQPELFKIVADTYFLVLILALVVVATLSRRKALLRKITVHQPGEIPATSPAAKATGKLKDAETNVENSGETSSS